jgi:hypothetical protein
VEFKAENLHWLVRGKFDRALSEKAAGGAAYVHLLEKVASTAPLGEVEFEHPKQRRKVRQTLRAAQVTLRAPWRKHEKLDQQTITVLYAHEECAPEGKDPVSWFLLTDREIGNFDDAVQILQFYLCRWQIEVFFRVLKSGCKVEKLQLHDVNRLNPCLALFAIIAWRVMFLTTLGRSCPDIPCTVVFEDCEWQAAYIVANRTLPPKKPPPLYDIVKMIASFGGYLGRTADGPPGVTAMWIGLQRTRDFALAHQSMASASTDQKK